MEAVIFDMDGVIVDSEPLSDQHEAVLLPQLGIDINKLSPKRSFRGMNAKTLWTTLKDEYRLEDSLEDLIQRGRASYLSFLENMPEIPIVPGAQELIQTLSETNFRMALASSGNPKRVELFLKRLELAQFFEVVVHGDDVVHGKPNPEVFIIAADRLGVGPSDCVVIEDSTAGVGAAKAAGMLCLGFNGLAHNHEDLSAADATFSDFQELTEFVKQGHKLSDYVPSQHTS